MARPTRDDVRFSLNRALWGEVTPGLRAVTVRVDDGRVEALFVYADPLTDEVREAVSAMETQVIADLWQDAEVEFTAVHLPPGRPVALPEGHGYVHLRREPASAVRAGRRDDAAAVLALWAVAAENTGRPSDDDPALLDGLLVRDPDALLVAELNGALVGTVVAGWDGWRAHLYRLAVHPEQRRHGIGSALIAAAEERLARLGARRFDAMVLDGNDLGAGLWRSAGYRPQDDWTRWVKDGPRAHKP